MTSRRQPDDSLDPLLRAAARQADDARRANACLEPDVIASWADGHLGRADTAALESHAASCDRCRAVLAALIRTIPAAAEKSPWWKAPVLRWAAPLGAVAGAAIIFVTLDRTIGRDREMPADSTLSAPAVLAERDTPPAPTVAAVPVEPPEGRVQPDAARTRQPAPSQQVAESVKPAPSPPAAPPTAPAPRGARAEAAPGQLATDAIAGFQSPDRGPLMLASPDKSVRWRVLPGRVERTTDGGETWDTHPLATTVLLTTGGCPSPDVCWIAGAAGTVLRTTDGRTWVAVASPDSADITSIRPTDALTAVLTTADGRSFVTADGGQTWSLRPLQDSPAAPF